MSFSMINLFSLYLLPKHKQICFIIPYSICFWNEDICFGQHLNNLHRKNIGRIILAHININSICCKFDQLVYGVKGKVDVLMIAETKLDDSFLTMQFNIEWFYIRARWHSIQIYSNKELYHWRFFHRIEFEEKKKAFML